MAASGVVLRNAVNQKRAAWAEASVKADREAAEAQGRFDRLQNAYGGRTNLDELEAAMRAYEETNPE